MSNLLLPGVFGVVFLLARAEPQKSPQPPAKKTGQDLEVAFECKVLTVDANRVERAFRDCETGRKPDTRIGKVQRNAAKENKATDLVPEQPSILDRNQTKKFLECFQGLSTTQIMQAPHVTVDDGQQANLDISDKLSFVTSYKAVKDKDQLIALPKNETVSLGFRMSLRPIVSEDRRSVQVKLAAANTKLEEPIVPIIAVTTHLTSEPDEKGARRDVATTQYVQQPMIKTMSLDTILGIPDGSTAVLQWGTIIDPWGRLVEKSPCPFMSSLPYVGQFYAMMANTAEYQPMRKQVLLLVTPRIVVRQEEEERLESPPDQESRARSKRSD